MRLCILFVRLCVFICAFVRFYLCVCAFLFVRRHQFPNLEKLSFVNSKELSTQSVKQVEWLLVRLYITRGSRKPLHIFASLQLTTSTTQNCVWTSTAVLALKTRPFKPLLQLMWSGQSWTSVGPKLRTKASASSAKNWVGPIFPSSKCYLECHIQFSRGVHILI